MLCYLHKERHLYNTIQTGYKGSSKFINNNAEHSGGAIAIENNSSLKICSGTFFNNSAIDGGAINVIESTAFFFGDIKFASNKAKIGGALSSWKATITTGLSKPFPHTCAQFGSETFAAAHNALEKKTNIIFQYNTVETRGGGWSSFLSHVTITGTVKFTHNRAYRGGGLYSYNNVIEFKSPLTLIFFSNTAKDIGGAIFYEEPYVDPLKVTRSINCFFMVTVDNDSFSHINIDFVDSHAENGIDIFGNDLDRCRVYINNTESSILGYQFGIFTQLYQYISVYIFFPLSTLRL